MRAALVMSIESRQVVSIKNGHLSFSEDSPWAALPPHGRGEREAGRAGRCGRQSRAFFQ